jgi:hypothetical protein
MLVFSGIVVPQQDIQGQSSFYPLHIGDYWEYYDNAGFGGGVADTIEVLVVKDSMIANRIYKLRREHSIHYGVTSIIIERYDSVGDLVRYNKGTGMDELWYRLSDTSASPWRRSQFISRYDSIHDLDLFGTLRRVLHVTFYDSSDTNLANPLFAEILAESLGFVSSQLPEGAGYQIKGARIGGRTFGTITSISDAFSAVSPSPKLFQNYPNPFNPFTEIEYSIPVRGRVELKVYDALGKEVATLVLEDQAAGRHSARFDAQRLSSGLYLYRLVAPSFYAQQKMLLVR